MSDAGKYVAGGIIGTAIAGLIAYAIYNSKKAEWDREREQMQYEIHTLEGEVLSQGDYIRRLESRLLELQDAHSRQLGSITNGVDLLLMEVEDIRSRISKESEFYTRLTSVERRLKDMKELAAIQQAVPAFR